MAEVASQQGGAQTIDQQVCERLDAQLELRMAWNREYELLSFICNFLVPQQNPLGRLFPRFDIRNPEYFVERLNEHLERSVQRFKNAYILDIDRISASFGRRYVQDDSVEYFSHGSLMGLSGPVSARIEPLGPMSAHYEVTWPQAFAKAVWNEVVSMYRTVRRIDPVKLVAVDLDDTLWRGVSGDLDEIDGMMVEGWPLGLAESLLYLKKRGVLLAIVSRNEEARVRTIWPKIFRDRLSLEDFAAVKINWEPKTGNMRRILEAANLLPRNIVFIDDNPAERAAMASAFPEMRILGRHPYYLRRILLWSAETQVPFITEESARRTEMVQAQFAREERRTSLTREDFLREAAPRVTLSAIAGSEHPRFKRAFELINKTNQFNTTGRRWKAEECEGFLARGQFYAFEVEDRFTSYGLVGVVIVDAGSIVQWVMSCRVLGYRIEEAVMAALVAELRGAGVRRVTGGLIETDVNFPCRDLFARCGFGREGEIWVLAPEAEVAAPGHVATSWEGRRAEPRPEGCVDGFENGCIVGWVWDAAQPGRRLQVTVTAGGEAVALGTADRLRHDLIEFGKADGCYGFAIALPQHHAAHPELGCFVAALGFEIPFPRQPAAEPAAAAAPKPARRGGRARRARQAATPL